MNEMERSIADAMELATQEVIRWEFMARVGIFILITGVLFIFLIWLITSTYNWIETKKKELNNIIEKYKKRERYLCNLIDKNHDKLQELTQVINNYKNEDDLR